METILLSEDEVRGLITMKEAVEAVDKTFKGLGNGTVINPTKLNLDLGIGGNHPHYDGSMNAMPAYVGWSDTAGLKWIGGFSGKRKEMGLPYLTSLIFLLNPEIGNFNAIMEGAYITNLRTGAQTANALKYMTSKNSIRMGLYGAGVQGHTQVEAIAQLFDIKELRVYDVYKEAALNLAKNMKDVVKGKIIVVDDPKDAAVGDVVVSVTHAKDKFIKDDWIKPGTIVFPMGSYLECDDDLILNADYIILDHIGQALHRGALKDLNSQGKITEEHIFGTIGELAAGKKECKVSDDKRIICVAIGTGAMDIGVSSIVYEKAIKKGIGGKYKFV